MQTLLFAVGIFVFMITIYGTVMAGGEMLKRKQVDGLAEDIGFATRDDGVEILVGNPTDS